MESLPLSWENLKETINNLENKYDERTKQKYGIYWTDIDLAYQIIDNLFVYIDDDFIQQFASKKTLEPCVGMGSFIFALLKKLYSYNLPTESIKKVIDNLYFCDINPQILQDFFTCYQKFVKNLWDIDITQKLFDKNALDGLIYKIDSYEYISLNSHFCEPIKFDLIITNPPYKNLKINAKDYTDSTDYEKDKHYYKSLSAGLKTEFNLANKGVLNLYKLFIEKILTEYCSDNAYVSLLIPNTFLADKTTYDIRKYCLEELSIKQIDIFSEKNKFFKNVTQAFSNLYIHSSKSKTQTQEILFNTDGSYMKVKTDSLQTIDRNLSLYPYREDETQKLLTLSQFPKIAQLAFVKNMRGELDITQYKSFITEDNHQLPLIKGKHLKKYTHKADFDTYANKEFIEQTNKAIFIKQERLACPQISNQTSPERLKFCWVNPDMVLANSCNFIVVEYNTLGYDLHYFLGLLNTPIINWYFKKFNSNNHIGNYEIDNFPVHNDLSTIRKISEKTKEYLQTKNSQLLSEIEDICLEGFNLKIKKSIENILLSELNQSDIIDERKYYKKLVSKEFSHFENISVLAKIIKRYYLSQSLIMNNIGFKLSDLDLEMIQQVPQGGNWKNISQETVQKSQRLIGIKKTGGRTTLYGRIKYDEPVYTVTTYFNRPGNGTYVHPILDRVITAREAARLQSFPDNYYFYGNKKDILTQIGNAVPCLFAQKIGEHLLSKLPSLKTFGDLFCGAGGMSQGMSQAGLTPIFANDIALPACVTYQTNHPNTKVIEGSIEDDKVKNQVHRHQGKIDILCGGPPCQGFSHAGKRIVDDPRNRLFLEFIDTIAKLRPKVVVMENVQGFLTLDKGNFYEQAKEMLQDLGYICKGKLLNTVHFGVPQKRKRVIILGIHKDHISKYTIDDFFPKPTTEEPSQHMTAFQAISDLECIEPNTQAQYQTK